MPRATPTCAPEEGGVARAEISSETLQEGSRTRTRAPSLAAGFVPSSALTLAPTEKAKTDGITKVFQTVATMRAGRPNATDGPTALGTTGS